MSSLTVDDIVKIPQDQLDQLARDTISQMSLSDLCLHVSTVVNIWEETHGFKDTFSDADLILDALSHIAYHQIELITLQEALVTTLELISDDPPIP